MLINLRSSDGEYTRLTLGEEDFLLTENELQHLEERVGKAVDRWNDSTRPIDHPYQ